MIKKDVLSLPNLLALEITVDFTPLRDTALYREMLIFTLKLAYGFLRL